MKYNKFYKINVLGFQFDPCGCYWKGVPAVYKKKICSGQIGLPAKAHFLNNYHPAQNIHNSFLPTNLRHDVLSEHFLNTLALTFISFLGRFVFAVFKNCTSDKA